MLFRPAISSRAKRPAAVDQFFEAKCSGRNRVLGIHDDNLLHRPQRPANVFQFLKHARVLDEDEARVRVIQNIAEFVSCDIRSAWHVRAAGDQDSVVAQDPLRPVIGEQSDMFSLAQPEINKRGRQRKAVFVQLPIRNRLVRARGILGCKGGKLAELFSGLPIKIGQGVCGNPHHAKDPAPRRDPGEGEGQKALVQRCPCPRPPMRREAALGFGGA
jgi:hypothetical protein